MRDRYYQGPTSDHFDGVRFFHPGLPPSDKSLLEIVKWKLFGNRTRWPDAVPSRTGIRPPAHEERLSIIHVGHASYLVQASGHNILVDPVWSDRASPVTWAGPPRHNPPAIAFEDIPPIHTVLVTHNHYDHMDTRTLRRVWERHRAPVVTPLGNDAILRAAIHGIQVQAGDWWARFPLSSDIQLTVVPSYHWSSRTGRDVRMALWGGFLLETPSGAVYCAGDTAYRDGAIFREIGRRFGPPVVAVLPIGAYAPRWFMETQHADPDDAVRIGLDCGAHQILGVHWGTFALTDEPFDEPCRRLAEAAQVHSLDPARIQALRPGDRWSI